MKAIIRLVAFIILVPLTLVSGETLTNALLFGIAAVLIIGDGK